jgi:hypothetical protein
MSAAEVEKLRMDCVYADPATNKALVLSNMCKTAAARQNWIRSTQPSITEVIEQYPRLEDVPHELASIEMLHVVLIEGNLLSMPTYSLPMKILRNRLLMCVRYYCCN